MIDKTARYHATGISAMSEHRYANSHCGSSEWPGTRAVSCICVPDIRRVRQVTDVLRTPDVCHSSLIANSVVLLPSARHYSGGTFWAYCNKTAQVYAHNPYWVTCDDRSATSCCFIPNEQGLLAADEAY